ncbi:MAG: hypothetical protein NC344_05720 [Bacteroidales bacterium]|nr:hypothetical protein [Bacteroidales bacterium]MCM1147318.1 hypothetical protein [Bacteroidales bacterium]MCM1206248.1 hypothetical protein [Bacillota bacterium]
MEKIIIEQTQGNGFSVIQGDKYSDKFGYDEMLGLVSALTMPQDRPCLQWMKNERTA